jgi:hypothetical protein
MYHPFRKGGRGTHVIFASNGISPKKSDLPICFNDFKRC